MIALLGRIGRELRAAVNDPYMLTAGALALLSVGLRGIGDQVAEQLATVREHLTGLGPLAADLARRADPAAAVAGDVEPETAAPAEPAPAGE
jgi:hypothetical protein